MNTKLGSTEDMAYEEEHFETGRYDYGLPTSVSILDED